jgi:hypothetical protein
MKTETIEQKAIKLISKYSPWLKENLLIEAHLYEFDDVAGLIELARAEEREANLKETERLRGLIDIAYDHLLSCGYLESGPTLMQLQTGTSRLPVTPKGEVRE